MVNSLYGDSFALGDRKVDQRRLVVVYRPDFVLLLDRKTFVRVDPPGRHSLPMGPWIKPFSTSFKVVAKRLSSVSLSPELCTDSRRTSRLKLETFLRSSQVVLAGRNF